MNFEKNILLIRLAKAANLKMKNMKKLLNNSFTILSKTEMKKVSGGILTGTRYTNGSCFCDYLVTWNHNPDGTTATYLFCDEPCAVSNCITPQ